MQECIDAQAIDADDRSKHNEPMQTVTYPVLQTPFHEGEQALQQDTGAFGTLSVAGPRVIRSFMPDQHRDFFAQLPWVVLGTVDGAGQPWASALAGPPGFMHSPDPQHLVVKAAAPPRQGQPVGLLGIEPHTRRRNRMNGVVGAVHPDGFTVQVSQSFGNCPKYIQAREPSWTGAAAGAQPQDLPALDNAARQRVATADTLFIATAHPDAAAGAQASHGVDVSHRGGRPGFVRLAQDGRLQVPDYNGNHFFNTLGNLLLNPLCGLLFVDYESGALLQVAARAELVTDGPLLREHAGALRVLVLQVLAVRRHGPGALPLAWGPARMSPVLP